jgi:hypothetical protein
MADGLTSRTAWPEVESNAGARVGAEFFQRRQRLGPSPWTTGCHVTFLCGMSSGRPSY